jgi:predicted DNA binding CopG/RHH family protein
MKKKIPKFKSDKEAEDFVAKADLTRYDLSNLKPARFRFEPELKDARLNLRLPARLMRALKAQAKKRGIPTQRLVREALEDALHH